jgi:hypothetical protein
MAEMTSRIVGFAHLIVCAPKTAMAEEVVAWANIDSPTGIASPWTVAEQKVTADGHPIPAQCLEDPDKQHWLLAC